MLNRWISVAGCVCPGGTEIVTCAGWFGVDACVA
jgi:hypothetical protein